MIKDYKNLPSKQAKKHRYVFSDGMLRRISFMDWLVIKVLAGKDIVIYR